MFDYSGDILLFFNKGTAAVSMIGTLLFVYWWMVMRKATAVYIYVLILIFAIGMENLAEFILRYGSYEFIKTHTLSPFWQLQNGLVFVTTNIFVSHMATRIYSTRFRIKKMKEEIKRFYNPNASFHVMIIEDNPAIPGILFKYIRNKCRGASVVLKSSAEEAIKFIEEGRPVSMIICDMNLKGKMDGFDFVRYVKKARPWVVNIGMTGYPNRYVLNDARKAGFDDYFVKPFRLEDISKSMNYHRAKIQRWGLIANRKE